MPGIQDLNKSIIELVVHCHYRQDETTLGRLNISKTIASRIAQLPSNVRFRLETQTTPFIDFSANESAINSAINSCYASGTRDELYNKAIKLGSSKAIMRMLCSMSSNEFARRRKLLNITNARVRPQSLTLDEELDLGKLYLAIEGKKDSLESLVWISEKSGIEINRIYTYFISNVLEQNR